LQIKNELNNIRTGLAGTKALVTTYTYKPFVGMASETDPNGKSTFYDYDDLNRLTLIRDKDNNIIKKICYNYHGQPEDCTSSNCTNTSPVWQNTATALRCQKDWTGQNTGYQEQEQIDINSCSLSYNQTQWVSVGQNTTACPLPVYVNLTSTNVAGYTGYTANYFNTATSYTYTFAVPATTGLQSLGAIPEGNYTLTIARTSGAPLYGTFKSGCFKQTATGTSAQFFNVGVSTITCNSITIDVTAQ
jgi:YD repeat-containing protein